MNSISKQKYFLLASNYKWSNQDSDIDISGRDRVACKAFWKCTNGRWRQPREEEVAPITFKFRIKSSCCTGRVKDVFFKVLLELSCSLVEFLDSSYSVAYPCKVRKGSCMRKRMGMKSSSNKLLLYISLLILNIREFYLIPYYLI